MADKDSEEEKIKEQLAAIEKELAEALDDDLAKVGEDINNDSATLQREKDLDRETARYRANALDRASTSLVTIGVFTPMIGILYHSSVVAVIQTQELVGAVFGCLVVAFALHWVGRGFLETGFRQ
ncbi:hypothetical protein MPL1032_220012 [Mesorhizobium plurifarium]|uniref:Uncharacterized protein n=1 Tax=Mesorhizobium plurifarium TaxID=69974 RepID=A0A0K2VYT0_MESPL|nr:hypothetical protein MPL1032_220012 [Mesorhizobium plurifarium]